jgi:hypothetical protein
MPTVLKEALTDSIFTVMSQTNLLTFMLIEMRVRQSSG